MLSVIPENRSKDAWLETTWKQEWEALIWTHPSTSPRIGPRTRRRGRITESKTLDDHKQTANWGRSVQSIHEEVGTCGQCGM